MAGGAEGSLKPSARPPPPARLSALSPSGRLLATAATSREGAHKAGSASSRVKVWGRLGGSCRLSGDATVAGQLAAAEPKASVEWQRQFLGHSVTAVLFVSEPERLLIGTDRGLLAAAEASSSSRLLFSTFLGNAPEGAEASEALDCASGSEASPVHALGRSAGAGGVLALVGGGEGSALYCVNPADGSLLLETRLRKPYRLMASAEASAEGLVLLAGNSEAGNSAALLLYDAPQQRPRAKLGGCGEGVWSAAIDRRARFAAAIGSGVGREELPLQLLIWKLPSRRRAVEERAIKAKKLQPICSANHSEPIAQVHLLARSDEALADDASEGEEQQRVVTLARSNAIVIWVLGSDGGDEDDLFSLTKLLTLDSVSFPCLAPSAALSPALVAAAAAPGVWFIQEFEEELRSADEEGEATGSEGAQTRPALFIMRGDPAMPLFQRLLLPRLSPRKSPQELYLPLLPRANATDDYLPCVEGLKLAEARAASSSSRKAGEKTGNAAVNGDAQNGEVRRPLPAATLKRSIAAATDGGDADEVDDGGVEGKKRHASVTGLAASAAAPNGEKSSVSGVLRQALISSDARLLETVLSSTAKDKKEVTAAVGSLSSAHALLLLQHLVQQQQKTPAASITKGGWIEEIVKQHALVLAHTDEGREQLVLLLLQVEERRRTESALVKVKGRLELLLQQMQRVQKLREERLKEEKEAREPLVVHSERAEA